MKRLVVLLACLLYAVAAFAFGLGATINFYPITDPPVYINKPALNPHLVPMAITIDNPGLQYGQSAYVIIRRVPPPQLAPVEPIYDLMTGQEILNGRIQFTYGGPMQRMVMVPIPQGIGIFNDYYYACESPGLAHPSAPIDFKIVNLTVNQINFGGLPISHYPPVVNELYTNNPLPPADAVGPEYLGGGLKPLCLKTGEQPSNVYIEFRVNAGSAPPPVIDYQIPLDVMIGLTDYGIDVNDHNNNYTFGGHTFAQPTVPPSDIVWVNLDPSDDSIPTIIEEIRSSSYGITVSVDDYYWTSPEKLPYPVQILDISSEEECGEYYAIGEALEGAGTLTYIRLAKIADPCHNISANFDTAVPLHLLEEMGAKGIPTSQDTNITLPNDAWGVLDDPSANAEDILKCLDQMCRLIGYGNLFEGDHEWYFFANTNGSWTTSHSLTDYNYRNCSVDGTEKVGFHSDVWGEGWYARIPALGGYTNGAYRYLTPGSVYWNSIGDVGPVISDDISGVQPGPNIYQWVYCPEP